MGKNRYIERVDENLSIIRSFLTCCILRYKQKEHIDSRTRIGAEEITATLGSRRRRDFRRLERGCCFKENRFRSMSIQEYSVFYRNSQINFQWCGLKTAFPDSVNVLNLEPWKENSYLLRLENIIANAEDPNYSKNVTVNIAVSTFSLYILIAFSEVKQTLKCNRFAILIITTLPN